MKNCFCGNLHGYESDCNMCLMQDECRKSFSVETVIKGLECILYPKSPCGDCHYFIPNPNDEETGFCDRDQIIKDAIKFLKGEMK